MIWIWIFITIALIVISSVAILNTLTFPRLKEIERGYTPRVSLLVPARDEEDKIESTVKHLLGQNHPNFEVIVLDDQSSDETAERALQSGLGDSRFRVVPGKALPDGWVGKNWACHQLSLAADGDVLIFTDADVRWKNPFALNAILDKLDHHNADILTVWPTQVSASIAERLVVPLIMFALLGYLPEICVRLVPWSVFAAANGQCMIFRKPVYESIGGHTVVSQEVLEDVKLVRVSKKNGYRLVMALGGRLISTHMYKNWREVRRGLAKNILAGHGDSPVFLGLSSIFHWMAFVVPWVWLVQGGFNPLIEGWPWWPLSLISLGLVSRALTAAESSQRILDALYLPISVIMMTIISAQSLIWHYREGGPKWKGRNLHAS